MHRPVRPKVSTMALGALAIGAAIAFSSFAVVRAEYDRPDSKKTYKCSTGTACLIGHSTGSAAGVAGTSTSGYGVSGTSGAAHLAGVYGDTTSSGVGVAGYSNGSGAAIGGSNTGSGVGVSAVATGNDAVYAYSQGGANGVYGRDDSVAGNGVFGYAPHDSGFGVVGEADGQTGAALTGVTSGNALLLNLGHTGTLSACYVDADANLACTGTISGGSLTQRHRSASGRHVLAYAAQSASATMEDVGEARLSNGIANVMISSDFASITDRSKNYYVFLTPLGDTRGLYVSMKTASAFQVRETMRGRSNVGFDYRIVAKPVDASDERLPLAPRMRKNHLPVHPYAPHVGTQNPPQ